MWSLAFTPPDPNIVGVYTIAGTLVIAFGYMLHDRRDTDKTRSDAQDRIDAANLAVVAEIRAQLAAKEADLEREREECRQEREALESDKRRYRELLDTRDAEIERLRDQIRSHRRLGGDDLWPPKKT